MVFDPKEVVAHRAEIEMEFKVALQNQPQGHAHHVEALGFISVWTKKAPTYPLKGRVLHMARKNLKSRGIA